MSWANDLNKLCTEGGENLGELASAIKIELFSGVVSDTRVDTGRLKGNWQIQENAPATGQLDRTDPTGAKVNREIQSGATEDGTTYFVNNLPYAAVYEEKDAMIGRNVARLKQTVARMARAIK